MRALLSHFIVLTAAIACGGTISQPATDGGGGDSGDSGASCCPADPTPGCCMHYGGWSAGGISCGEVCDGMPEPGDPSWHLVKDAHGCDVWSSTGSAGPTCGGVTNHNDPRCPPTFDASLCGKACTAPGLSCSYPAGGDAMFCNAVDGGAMWGCGV